MSMAKSDITFWDFSLKVYRKPGIANVCLALQEDYGADVNMLLFCGWYGATRGRFNDNVYENACVFSRGWGEHTVKPLRGVRNRLKQDGCHGQFINIEACMQFREKVKAIELQAEKLQQLTLENLCRKIPAFESSGAGRLEAVVKNLGRYLQSAGIGVSKVDTELLVSFIGACLDDADPARIRGMIG
jgi:uncharacterized protein (TIGR02444 family)